MSLDRATIAGVQEPIDWFPDDVGWIDVDERWMRRQGYPPTELCPLCQARAGRAKHCPCCRGETVVNRQALRQLLMGVFCDVIDLEAMDHLTRTPRPRHRRRAASHAPNRKPRRHAHR